MNHLRRLLAPTVLLFALVASLVFAATAAAEVRSGEATSPVDTSIPGEADILSANLSYESTAGNVTLAVTTREAPNGANQLLELAALLGTGAQCNEYPQLGMVSYYDEPEPEAEWEAETAKGAPPTSGPVTKTVSGDTTTLSATGTSLANQPYSCAIVLVIEDEETEDKETLLDYVKVTLSTPQTTPPSSPTTPSAPTPPSAAPAPPPAALSIGKSKPLKLKVGKWAKVNVKVSDTGGTATGSVALKVKAPAGVTLKPASGKLKLAALQPGETKTVSFKLKLTEGAKAKSTLSLAATASGPAADGSLIVKLSR